MAEQKTATKATSQPKPMTIHTCYVIDIKSQLVTEKGEVTGSRRVDESLMRATRKVCLDALKFCAELFLKEWENLKGLQSLEMKSRCEVLIHTTKDSIAKYPEFDEKFPYMPSYTRRAIVADALGIVRSYKSNHKNWEALSPAERGAEPKMGFPTIYELTFYKQERRLNFSEGVMELKLYDGTKWDWYAFRINKSESEYIAKMSKTRKLLSPVVEKVKEKYRVRFCFEEKRQLVQNECPLKYRILVVDLGINAPASWSVLTADGTVHARGVIHLGRDEDRLNRRINRKRMYQQAGKKSKNIYRAITSANQQLPLTRQKPSWIPQSHTMWTASCSSTLTLLVKRKAESTANVSICGVPTMCSPEWSCRRTAWVCGSPASVHGAPQSTPLTEAAPPTAAVFTTTNTVTKSITTVYVSSRTGRYTTVISMHRITSGHGSSSGSMRSWMAARNSLRCRCVHWIPF